MLVAGGIGVTPMLSHARAAARWGRSFEVLYGHRPGAGAHLDELRGLAGDRLAAFPSTPDMLAAVRAALADRPIGTHVYVCGPAPLIVAWLLAQYHTGWVIAGFILACAVISLIATALLPDNTREIADD